MNANRAIILTVLLLIQFHESESVSKLFKMFSTISAQYQQLKLRRSHSTHHMPLISSESDTMSYKGNPEGGGIISGV